MRILIVDDELTTRLVLEGILGDLGKCDIAVNGEEALQAFHYAWEENNPYELICLDIVMPKMDGKAVLKSIREYESTNYVPENQCARILMISAQAEQAIVLEAVKSGANWYLVKPISTEKMMDELKRLGFI